MTAPCQKIPLLKLHKATGQAYVRIQGQIVYFGKFADEQSHQKYHRFIAELTSMV